MDAARSTCVRNGWQLLPEAILRDSEGNWSSAEVTVCCVLWWRCAVLILSPQRFHGCRACPFKWINYQKWLEKRVKIRVTPRVHRNSVALSEFKRLRRFSILIEVVKKVQRSAILISSLGSFTTSLRRFNSHPSTPDILKTERTSRPEARLLSRFSGRYPPTNSIKFAQNIDVQRPCSSPPPTPPHHPRSLPSYTIAHFDWLVIHGPPWGRGEGRLIRGQQSFAELIVTGTQDAELHPTTGLARLVFLRLKKSF